MRKLIFFSILTTLAFSYCKSQEDNTLRTFDCYVRYDEVQGVERAECHLVEGATSGLGAQIPGGVTYRGEEMKAMEMHGVQYRLEKKTPFPDNRKFAFAFGNKKNFEFDLPMDGVKNFRFEEDTIVRFGQAAKLRWDGRPLQKGESMVLLWEKEDNSQTVPIELISQASEPVVDFPAAKLKDISKGKWILYVVRKRLTKANVNGISVTGISELYSKTKKITVL